MGFLKQECWSRLSFPAAGDLSDLGIELKSLASPALAAELFTTLTPAKCTQLRKMPFWLALLTFTHLKSVSL